MGECSSMWYSLGVWDPKNSHHFQRSPIFQSKFAGKLESLAKHWNMSSEEAQEKWVSLILFTEKEKVTSVLENYEGIYLSFINSPKEIIISGDKDSCYAIAKELNCQS